MDSFKVAAFGFFALSGVCFANVEDQLILEQEVEIVENAPLQGWHDDYAKASALASERGVPLLIAFLGPNWCPFSDQLEADVLAKQEFAGALKNELVFLKVDIPEDWEEGNFSGEALKERFAVDECPCLVLVEPSGQAIAKLEYLPLHPKEFTSYIRDTLGDYNEVATLAEKQTVKKLDAAQLKSLYAKAGRLADATFKKVLLNEGLKVDKSPYFLVEEYGRILANGKVSDRKLSRLRNKIFARDPKNTQGFQRKLAIMDFEALSAAIKRTKGSEGVIKPLVQYLMKFGPEDRENSWKIEMKISQYLFGQNRIEEALKHARASLNCAPESAREEVTQSVDYLQAKKDAQME